MICSRTVTVQAFNGPALICARILNGRLAEPKMQG
jgi:hypothetical protein